MNVLVKILNPSTVVSGRAWSCWVSRGAWSSRRGWGSWTEGMNHTRPFKQTHTLYTGMQMILFTQHENDWFHASPALSCLGWAWFIWVKRSRGSTRNRHSRREGVLYVKLYILVHILHNCRYHFHWYHPARGTRDRGESVAYMGLQGFPDPLDQRQEVPFCSMMYRCCIISCVWAFITK